MGSTEALALFSAFILVGFVIEAREEKTSLVPLGSRCYG